MEEPEPRHVYAFGPYRLDPRDRRLSRNGQPMALPPKVFDTLTTLVAANGRLVEKSALLERLWPDTHVEDVNLARNVSLLRKALGESGDGQGYVETVSKQGYRFVAPVRLVDPSEPPGPDGVQRRNRPTWALMAGTALAVVTVVLLVRRLLGGPRDRPPESDG